MSITTPITTQSTIKPKTLLIYYGIPSLINQTRSVPAAAAELGRYDYVVLGDGLEKAAHADHENTVAILAHPAMRNTFVFGYIDLGLKTQGLPMEEVHRRVDEWQATGARGIFFDDFGYDFWVTRERQNTAVEYAHARGMPVVANAFHPNEAFGDLFVDGYNPDGVPAALGAQDFYLFESYQIKEGEFEPEAEWQHKSTLLVLYQDQIGFKILSVTTDDPSGAYDEEKFFYAWFSALLYGHEATAWGEYSYSTASFNDSIAPFRARPDVDPGTEFRTPVYGKRPWYARDTERCRIYVNASTHVAGLLALTASPPDAAQVNDE